MKKIKLLNKIYKEFIKFKKNPIGASRYLFIQRLFNIWINQMHKKYDGKIAILHYPPRYITIAISGFCMYQCLFCASHCPDSGKDIRSNHQYKMNYFVPYQEFCKIVDMCYKANVPHVHIVAAGEPFLHKDVFKMMDYLAYKYGDVSIQSDFDKNLFKKRNIFEKIIHRGNVISEITTDLFPPDVHNQIKIGSTYKDVVDAMEFLSRKTDIHFRVHNIITKLTYKRIDDSILELYKKNINFTYDIVNLHTHGFNEFTSPDNAYLSSDIQITTKLNKIRKLGEKLGIKINIPEPWDEMFKFNNGNCLGFWNRFQITPSKRVHREKWVGNAIPSQCNAVVIGDLYSLGNIFDYDNLMELWNNTKFIHLRKNLINGKYPDKMCKTCYLYDEKINGNKI